MKKIQLSDSSICFLLKLNAKENLKVFSKGFLIFEFENKYDMSIFKISKSNPVPNVKNFLAPLSKLSLKYPVLKKTLC